MTSREVHVTSYPNGAVGPEHFTVVEAPLPRPGAGEVLVRNTWTSVDPGMRLRLRPAAPAGYFTAFELDRPLDGVITVGEVVESCTDGFEVGDTVWHPFGWRSHAVVPAGVELMNGAATLRRLDVTNARPEWYLGPLGAMGLTAWSGLHVVDALKGGETIWVSAAAGAVGSLVARIGVLLGHRVIASAGSDEKVAWLRDEIGVAAAFNHRRESPAQALPRLAPEGLDVYFDNVGGGHLEAALDAMAMHGRIALCGSVSDYESEPVGPRNIFLATARHVTLQGFRGSLHSHLIPQMQERLGEWLRTGELVPRMSVYEGLESAPLAMADMLAGRTTGKTVIRIP